MSVREMRKFVRNYYQEYFLNREIFNEDLKITISLTSKGRQKMSFGEAMYPKKAAVIFVLDKLIQYSEYNNWGNRKNIDPKELVGYYNFKGFVYIDEKKECVRLAVRILKTGEIYFYPYYNLEINKKKQVKESRGL
ncbi:MAG: hypothetical protein LBR45_04905 [Bacteroidales bacterium]|nr:hypothetical protein [Bacteroidales bacterium]